MPKINQYRKKQLLQKYSERTQSTSDFCKENKVAPSTLYKWQKTNEEKPAEVKSHKGFTEPEARFIEATIKDQPNLPLNLKPGFLIITTPAGCVIEVPL